MRSSRWGPRGRRRLAPMACVAVIAAVIAAGLGGCGSGSDPGAVTARAYVSSVCHAVGPFEHEIALSSSALDPGASSSAAQVKRELEGFLTTIALDAQSAVTELKAAKHPDVHNGKAIGREFVAIFTRIRDAMKTAAQTSRRLPTRSAAAFKAADQVLGNDVKRSVVGDLGSGLAVLRNRALETAAAHVAACRAIG